MKGVVLLLLIAGVAFPIIVGYHIEPVKAAWSGLADPEDGVSQLVTCNFDELDSASGGYVELFAGFHGAGANYHLDIYEHPNGPRVAYKHDVVPGLDHTWLRFDRIHLETGESFTKGKQCEFRFTRSGSDSIQYYYQGGNPSLSDPYSWGWMRVGGTNEVCMDLCARVYGRSTVGGQTTAA